MDNLPNWADCQLFVETDSSLFALSAVPSPDEEARQGNTIFMIGTLTGHARLRASTS